MAIRDLLWACPLCGEERALRPGRGGESCSRCGATYSRGRGAEISATPASGEKITLSPAEWVDRLPPLGIEERIRAARENDRPLLEERVLLSTADGDEMVSFHGVYLNRIERFGPPSPGILGLETEAVVFRPDDLAPPMRWTFDAISAVQPSSSSLQLYALRLPLVSIKVPEGSIRFLEELLCAALRVYYRERGRGEIIEFQPRIATRPVP